MTTTFPGTTPTALTLKAGESARFEPCGMHPAALVGVKGFILALAGVILLSGQAAADNSWKYVAISPDGKQVAASTPQMDISFPPDETSGQDGVPAPKQRVHLIIIAPDTPAPEPTFLSNKAAEATVETPPKNLPLQDDAQAVAADAPQTVRRAPAPPPVRHFLNSGSNVRR